MVSPLWSDDEVEEREDGYLILKESVDASDLEEQPLLLHSSEVFLKELYPGMSRKDRLNHFSEPLSMKEGATIDESLATLEMSNDKSTEDMDVDVISNDSNAEQDTKKSTEAKVKKKKDSLKYQAVYQSLKRCNNLSNRIQPLLSDLCAFKHRPVKRTKDTGRQSRQNLRTRALEMQQQRLLDKHSTMDSSEEAAQEQRNEVDDENEDEPEQGFEEGRMIEDHAPLEPHHIRILRTLNSIRAVYVHILQIFNHKRRNDKLLEIGNSKWKSKKRGFAWLLGSRVFDASSSKLMISAYKDCCLVLESLVSVDTARMICQDPLGGSPDFWTKSWISEIKTRATPQILDPLAILTALPNAPDRKSLQTRTLPYDECLHLESTDSDTDVIQKQYDAAVRKVHLKISSLLKERFPEARVSIYGSCLSNLSLGKGADVDLSLWIPKAEELQVGFEEGRLEANKYQKAMKSLVFQVFHKLKHCGKMFGDLQPVTRARVPVVKGTYNFAKNPYSSDGSLNFDICFLNDIAVANSGLIREYSLVDPRVRKLMMAVKMFAKDRNMNSAKDGYISSYAWVNMVIFYLQCIGFVPNLQDAALMEKVDFVPNPSANVWHCVRKLDTWYLSWDRVQKAGAWSSPTHLSDTPICVLLYGFFEFYSRRFPSGLRVVSIKEGTIHKLKLDSKKAALFFSIEDPFETYDSHCPHDLSAPASETGIREMMEYFSDAEIHLRGILLGADSPWQLWPSYNVTKLKNFDTKSKEKAPNTLSQKQTSQSSSLNRKDPRKERNDKGGRGRGRGGRGGRRIGRGGRGGRGNAKNTTKMDEVRKGNGEKDAQKEKVVISTVSM